MNDIIIVCGLVVSTCLLIAWMLKNDVTFTDLDAWWNMQFEKFGEWFMY